MQGRHHLSPLQSQMNLSGQHTFHAKRQSVYGLKISAIIKYRLTQAKTPYNGAARTEVAMRRQSRRLT